MTATQDFCNSQLHERLHRCKMHCELDVVDYLAAGGGFRIERFAGEKVVPSWPSCCSPEAHCSRSQCANPLTRVASANSSIALPSPHPLASNENSTTLSRRLFFPTYSSRPVGLTSVPCSSAETTRRCAAARCNLISPHRP